MTTLRAPRLLLAALTVLLVSAPARSEESVTVFAAASLTEALKEIGAGFTAGGGERIRFSFASSALLARQIEAGAEADLFLSADAAWMDYLDARGLIDAASRRAIVANRLVLIARRDSTITLNVAPGFPLRAALGDGRLAIADPETVPAGRYAREALETLGVWATVEDRLVRAENVRVALAYVARGEAPLGIVYGSDAKVEPRVRTVDTFPETSHTPIAYPAALTKYGKGAGRALLDHLTSDAAAAIFERHGFLVLP